MCCCNTNACLCSSSELFLSVPVCDSLTLLTLTNAFAHCASLTTSFPQSENKLLTAAADEHTQQMLRTEAGLQDTISNLEAPLASTLSEGNAVSRSLLEANLGSGSLMVPCWLSTCLTLSDHVECAGLHITSSKHISPYLLLSLFVVS